MNEKSLSSKTKLRCHICGRRFKKGGTRYRINLEVISDFDGYIKDMTEEELEEEIYLKRNWLVCINCREKFIRFLKRINE